MTDDNAPGWRPIAEAPGVPLPAPPDAADG